MAQHFFFPQKTYVDRRQQLMKSVKGGKILLLGNNESSRNYKDNWYPYRQDSSFLYYAGINLPGLALIIDCDGGEATLYGNNPSIDDIIWMGNQPSLEELASKVGIENVKPFHQLFLDVYHDMHYLPPYRPEHILMLEELLHLVELKPSDKLVSSIIAQRNIKSKEELEQLDQACTISAKMHKTVMQKAKPGMYEYELVGLASKVAMEHGGDFSFPPILTINGQTLHNHAHHNKIKKGDMILFDGGVEVSSGYCGDMTRTFPADKKYGSLQKNLYKIVHNAYTTARKMSKPGVYYQQVHLAAAKEITKGLKALGWMKGDVNAAVKAGAHALFFQHGLGHMLGLDVHDMENLGEENVGYDSTIKKSKQFGLRSLRLGRKLKEGFVLTIEPGLYVIPELIDKFEAEKKHLSFLNYNEINKYRDAGGIRIEDDFVVTKTGVRQLGDPLVTDVNEVEKLRN